MYPLRGRVASVLIATWVFFRQIFRPSVRMSYIRPKCKTNTPSVGGCGVCVRSPRWWSPWIHIYRNIIVFSRFTNILYDWTQQLFLCHTKCDDNNDKTISALQKIIVYRGRIFLEAFFRSDPELMENSYTVTFIILSQQAWIQNNI